MVKVSADFMKFVAYFFVTFVLLFEGRGAYKNNIEYEFTPDGSMFHPLGDPPQFAYLEGGRMSLLLDVQPANATVYVILTSTQYVNGIYSSRVRAAQSLRLCTYPSELRKEISGKGTRVNFVSKKMQRYTLYALNCRTDQGIKGRLRINGTFTAMNPQVLWGQTLSNVVTANETYHYLSAEYIGIIPIYLGFLFVHVCVLGAFSVCCFVRRDRTVLIHLIFFVMQATKCIDLGMQAKHQDHMKWEGSTPELSSTATMISSSLNSVVFLCTLLILAFGFSITRQELSGREIRWTFVAFLSYLGASVIHSYCVYHCDSIGPYTLAEYIMKSVIMLGIIIAMNFNITKLRFSILDNSWGPRTADTYVWLSAYYSFRWSFLIYLLLPTANLIIKITVFTWKYEWANVAFTELAMLYIHARILLAFLPNPGRLSEYHRIGDAILNNVSFNGPIARNPRPSTTMASPEGDRSDPERAVNIELVEIAPMQNRHID